MVCSLFIPGLLRVLTYSQQGVCLSIISLKVIVLITGVLSHNELDLPSITSPLMYEKISARRSVPQLYEEKLLVCTTSLVFSAITTPYMDNRPRKSLTKRKLRMSVAPTSLTLSPSFPKSAPTPRQHPCWRTNGKESSGPPVQKLTTILRPALTVTLSRELAKQALQYQMAL